jgi:hypothetical protein
MFFLDFYGDLINYAKHKNKNGLSFVSAFHLLKQSYSRPLPILKN